MAIKGLGTDIIELQRIADLLESHPLKFLERILTPTEIQYCQQFNNYLPQVAGRFCAKEAIAKCFGTGIGNILDWQDLCIQNDEVGKPYVILSERVSLYFDNPKILLSISHSKMCATAVAIWQ